MQKEPLILGIETSCDETAASIIQNNGSGVPKNTIKYYIQSI